MRLPRKAALPVFALLLAALVAVPSAGSQGADIAPQPRPDKFAVCARPALAPAIAVAKPKQDDDRVAFQVAHIGRRLGEPARAQALAVTAVVKGELDKAGARAFYRSLQRVPHWETLPPSVAVHHALRAPDPFAYEKAWTRATGLLGRLAKRGGTAVDTLVSTGGATPKRCRSSVGHARTLPLPAGSGYQVRTPKPAAGRAPAGESLYEARCGTEVLAASAGKVDVVRSKGHTGPWVIDLHHKRSGFAVRYTHVQDVLVADGAAVLPGQPIAEVGDLGNVRSCALGVSVTREVKKRRAALDPAVYLVPTLGAPAKIQETSFRLSTYNVLGHHLTAPGGGRRGWASGTSRVARGLDKLEGYDVSIVILNEFETPQADVFLSDGDWDLHRATPNNVFRDGNSNGNAVAWRTDQWKQVATDEVTAPWKVTLHFPVVTLQHVETGAQVAVMALHNPAGGGAGGARAAARSQQLDYAHEHQEANPAIPLVIGGDFNERQPAFCGMTETGLLASTAGGSSGGGCQYPRHGPVDWLFATDQLDINGQQIDGSIEGSITDHPFVIGDFTFPEHDAPRKRN